MGSELLPQTRWTWVRTVINWANLSTPLGLLIAWIGGANIEHRGRGTYLPGARVQVELPGFQRIRLRQRHHQQRHS